MKTKGLKVLTAAAVLSLGLMTMEALAAEGWAMSGNTWVYMDQYGNRVTNEWRKGADNLWRSAAGQTRIILWIPTGSWWPISG